MPLPKIIIAGARMGGLATGLAFLRKGFDVDIYEQADGLREIGAGLWVSANGTRIYEALGILDELRAINLPPNDRVVRLWNTGERWSVYNRGNEASSADHTLLMVLRSELQRVLYEAVVAAKPGAVHFSKSFESFEDNGNEVTANFADGSSATGEILIGADGMHSAVRQHMFGPAERKFTGALTWRGLVPMSRVPSHHREPLATTWIGPTAHITSYPAQRGGEEFISFSAQVDSDGWDDESWSEPGEIEDALKDFEGWHQDVIEMLNGPETLFKWGIFVRPVLDNWSKGRATLLGDACHSMVPYLGQGLNIALEDGYVMARCLELDPDRPEAALQKYSDLRKDRAKLVVERSMDMLRIFHNEALRTPETAIPYIKEQWSPKMIQKRYDWIVNYDATTVEI